MRGGPIEIVSVTGDFGYFFYLNNESRIPWKKPKNIEMEKRV